MSEDIFISRMKENPAAREIMRIANLTPHALNIFDSAGRLVSIIEPSGVVARLEVRRELIASIDGVEFYRTTYGAPTPLPATEDGGDADIYVVSSLYLSGLRAAGLSDTNIWVPGEALRDEQGRQIGCVGLSR